MKEYTTLSEELAKLSPERQEHIKARASKIYFDELTIVIPNPKCREDRRITPTPPYYLDRKNYVLSE